MTVTRTDQDRLVWQPAAAAPVAARLRSYWQGLRDGDALPRRAQFEPLAMAPLLGSVFLVDWTDSGAARFRIAGQVFARLYGMALHGAPLALLFEPSERASVGRIVRQVCDEPAVADLVLRSAGSAGQPAMTGRMLLLPVADASGVARLAIGSLEVGGVTGRTPRRFAIERCLRTPLRVE